MKESEVTYYLECSKADSIEWITLEWNMTDETLANKGSLTSYVRGDIQIKITQKKKPAVSFAKGFIIHCSDINGTQPHLNVTICIMLKS